MTRWQVTFAVAFGFACWLLIGAAIFYLWELL